MTENRTADENLWIECCLEAFRSLRLGANPWSPPATSIRFTPSGRRARMFGYCRIYLVIHDTDYPDRINKIGYVTLTGAGRMDLYGCPKLTRLVKFARSRAYRLFRERQGALASTPQIGLAQASTS